MPYIPPPSYRTVPKLKSHKKFIAAMQRAEELKAIIHEADAATAELDTLRKEVLLPILAGADLETSVQVNSLLVSVVTRADTEKLDKKKLVTELESRNVPKTVIAAAMKAASTVTPGSTFVQIRTSAEAAKDAASVGTQALRALGAGRIKD